MVTLLSDLLKNADRATLVATIAELSNRALVSNDDLRDLFLRARGKVRLQRASREMNAAREAAATGTGAEYLSAMRRYDRASRLWDRAINEAYPRRTES